VSSGRVLFGLVMCAAGCEPAVCAAPGGLCLGAPTRTHWGFSPDSVQRMDVDGDGLADLAAASHVRGTVSVVWGADASLGEVATTWSIGPEVAGLVAADLDGDGRVDLATAVTQRDEVVVLRGRGDREFVERRISLPGGPRGLIAAQLEEGGVVELVTVNGDGTVSVVRGEQVTSTVVGPEPRGMCAADFNGDGAVDVIVAVTGRAALQVLLGDGSGGLMVGETFAVGAAPESVVAADFNDDGAVDLASADLLEGAVSVLFGDGKGGVMAREVWATEPEPEGLVVVPGVKPMLALVSRATGVVQTIDPRNGEGVRGASVARPDVLMAGADGELMYVGGGQIGTMRPESGVRLGKLWEIETEMDVTFGWVIPVDLDGDGVDELVVVKQRVEDNFLVRMEVWRDGVKTEEIDWGRPAIMQDAKAADLDGDGVRDLVLFGGSGGTVVRRVEGAWRVDTDFRTSSQSLSLEVADVDGDGRSELIAAGNGAVEVLGLDEDGVMQTLATIGVVREDGSADYVWRVMPVDVDGDDQLDVVWATNEGFSFREDVLRADLTARRLELGLSGIGVELELFDMDEDGALDGLLCTWAGLAFVSDVFAETPGAPVRAGGYGCSDLAIADVHADGAPEVLAQRYEDDRVVMTPWTWSGGAWSEGASAVIDDAAYVQYVQLDGDGVPDVLTWEFDLSARGWRTSGGDGLVAAPLRSFGASGPVFGDFNNDGVLDAFGYGAGLAVAFGDGDGGFAPMRHTALPAGVQSVNSAVVDDFDGDGVADAVLSMQRWDSFGSELVRVEVDAEGGISTTAVALLELSGVRLAVGDLDEDGVRDLVTHEEETGLVLLRNEGDGKFAAPRLLGATRSASVGRVMDIDDDGHVDFVARGLNDVFVLRGLGGGEMAPLQLWWRGFSKELEFADMTGDGRKDLLTIGPSESLLLVAGPGATPRWLASRIEATSAVDFDGDGRAEVLAVGPGRHPQAGQVVLQVGRWGPDGLSFVGHEIEAAPATNMHARDFDGDGDIDVALLGSGDITIVRQEP